MILFVGGSQHHSADNQLCPVPRVTAAHYKMASLFVELLRTYLRAQQPAQHCASNDCRPQACKKSGKVLGGLAVGNVSVYGQILYDKHQMLLFVQEMRESGVHCDPSAWPLGTFITSLQRACLQVRQKRSTAASVLQGTLQKVVFVSLEDILVPDALCQEMMPQVEQSGAYYDVSR